MSLSVTQIEGLERRRKASLDMGVLLCERPLSDAIDTMKARRRLKRLLRDYPTVEGFLSADICDLVSIPGISTSTLGAIQDAIEGMSTQVAGSKRTPSPSIGERMLVETALILQTDEKSTFDVVLRNGTRIEWIVNIRIDEGIAYLRSGNVRTEGRDHTHVVDASEVVLVRRADGEGDAAGLILKWASDMLHDRDQGNAITITMRGGGQICGVDMIEHDVDTVQIGVVGYEGVSHYVSTHDIVAAGVDPDTHRRSR